MSEAFSRFWKKYATFSGRASRSEYWWVQLVFVVIYAAFGVPAIIMAGESEALTDSNAQAVTSPGVAVLVGILVLITLAAIVPSYALMWRRLHDVNLSGGFFFLNLIPSVGSLIVLIMTLLPSNPQGERFDRY